MRGRIITLLAGVVAVVIAVVAVVWMVTGDGADDPSPASAPTKTSPVESSPASHDPALDNPDWDRAVSTPVEDSVYPNVGDPSVDALHYDLDLTWLPDERQLSGVATVAFRATRTQDVFQLDLGATLEIEAATLDGADVEVSHVGKDLVVKAPVVTDQRYLLEVTYSGEPEPFPAPTTRSDFSSIGFTVTDSGAAWTMQEPYGAFTWYPVNDQPADKAFYDFTLRVPDPFVGVANGELTSRSTEDDLTVTTFHLDSPASSYLTTVAFDDYVRGEATSSSGVPLTWWTPRGDDRAARAMSKLPEALAWAEEKLGDYPFDRLGAVVVPSQTAMETQTMMTIGNTAYALDFSTLVHEVVHQWYGNLVSPTDWSDVWMNEGITTYLDFVHDSEDGPELADVLTEAARYERIHREQSGPPGDYDPRAFGQTNIYYGPALMWHQVRERVGDDVFWAMVKKWPTVHAYGNATRDDYLAWVEKETATELSDLFDAWLLGETTPPMG